MKRKTSFSKDAFSGDKKDFIDPGSTGPVGLLILQTMLTTTVTFFTWESLKQIFRKLGWKKDDTNPKD